MFDKVVYVGMFCVLAILLVLLIVVLVGLKITPGPMPLKLVMSMALFIGICEIIAMYVMIISFWREDKAKEELKKKAAEPDFWDGVVERAKQGFYDTKGD